MKTPPERPTHQTSLELGRPLPVEVEIGSEIVLRIRARCLSECDLTGQSVTLVAGEETLTSASLAPPSEEPQTETLPSVQPDPEPEEPAEIATLAVKAPVNPGDYTWTLVLGRHEGKTVIHEEASLPVAFTTTPHATSLAVWEIPSPVVVGTAFTIKVGARSSGAHSLHGAVVDVRNEKGERVASGTLGDTPWQGTTALYWAEVEIAAPMTDGVASWSVAFAPVGVDVPHNEGAAAFSFAVVQPPQHTVTVTVLEKESRQPIEAAYVRIGPHRGATDEDGVATVPVPSGTFEVIAWKVGYLPPSATVEVAGDVSVQLEAEIREEDNPWALPV